MRYRLSPNMMLFVLLLVLPACQGRDALPGPSINTFTQTPSGDPGQFATSRSNGVVEMYLTKDEPSHTFYNYPKAQHEPWGTVTLQGVAEDRTVTITLNEETLRARPGRAFPGTGIHVIASEPSLGTALLRSRFTHTLSTIPRPPGDDAREIDRLPNFSSAHLLPDGRAYLHADRTPLDGDIGRIVLSTRQEPWTESCYADPGDTIHAMMEDVVGAGAWWCVYLGPTEDGRMLFHTYTWFYDIMPDSQQLVVIPNYGDPPSDL
ncbi:MAG: hypothetical protein ACIAXF_16820 [Phycisphaerales bacterium JB063]